MDKEQEDEPQAEASNEQVDDIKAHAGLLERRSVYAECSNACRHAVWTYLLADLREMAEKGKLDDDAAEKLDMPVTVNEILEVLTDNMDRLTEYLGKDKDLYLSSAKDWVRRDQKAFSSGASTQSSRIVFMDDFKKDCECVYIIALMQSSKRVLVSFRGSVTPKDWMVDAQAVLRDIPNPVHDLEEGQPENFGIHHGFFDYLYGDNTSTTNKGQQRRLGKTKPVRRQALNNKMQTILHYAAQFMEENPDYSLFSTGHSLGGALATIFACEAAASADPRIRKPVTCISIASPKVGNLSFRLAVEYLESHEKLRLLRVANQGDVVPLIPDVDLRCCAKGHVNSTYRHVGPKLYLQKRGYKLFRPRPAAEKKMSTYYLLELARDVKRFVFVSLVLPVFCLVGCKAGVDIYRAHNNNAYIKRLDENKDQLEKEFLGDFYAKEQSREKMN